MPSFQQVPARVDTFAGEERGYPFADGSGLVVLEQNIQRLSAADPCRGLRCHQHMLHSSEPWEDLECPRSVHPSQQAWTQASQQLLAVCQILRSTLPVDDYYEELSRAKEVFCAAHCACPRHQKLGADEQWRKYHKVISWGRENEIDAAMLTDAICLTMRWMTVEEVACWTRSKDELVEIHRRSPRQREEYSDLPEVWSITVEKLLDPRLPWEE